MLEADVEGSRQVCEIQGTEVPAATVGSAVFIIVSSGATTIFVEASRLRDTVSGAGVPLPLGTTTIGRNSVPAVFIELVVSGKLLSARMKS
jgi:hypothetical protein